MKFTTTLLHLNQMNKNGRIYPLNVNLIEKINEYNNRNHNYGEFGMPDEFEVNLKQISHTIDNVRVQDDKVVADITILDTPKGRELKENIDMVVFRPRPTGIVHGNGTVTINEILSYDAIDSSIDSFYDAKFIKQKESRRIFSDIDPYGEEEWV